MKLIVISLFPVLLGLLFFLLRASVRLPPFFVSEANITAERKASRGDLREVLTKGLGSERLISQQMLYEMLFWRICNDFF
jgi:hypothetical protein